MDYIIRSIRDQLAAANVGNISDDQLQNEVLKTINPSSQEAVKEEVEAEAVEEDGSERGEHPEAELDGRA